MRIVVTSDSHRSVGKLMDIVELHRQDADLFINLGDGEDDVDSVLAMHPTLKMERVCGNCDWYSTLPQKGNITIDGKSVFYTHGHIYHVKYGYAEIEAEAERIGADICLFGHTHQPYCERRNGVYYLNPGSVRDGRYGIVDIVNGQILAYNAEL